MYESSLCYLTKTCESSYLSRRYGLVVGKEYVITWKRRELWLLRRLGELMKQNSSLHRLRPWHLTPSSRKPGSCRSLLPFSAPACPTLCKCWPAQTHTIANRLTNYLVHFCRLLSKYLFLNAFHSWSTIVFIRIIVKQYHPVFLANTGIYIPVFNLMKPIFSQFYRKIFNILLKTYHS